MWMYGRVTRGSEGGTGTETDLPVIRHRRHLNPSSKSRPSDTSLSFIDTDKKR